MKRDRAQLGRLGHLGRMAAVGAFSAALALAGTVATPAPAEAATLSGLLKNKKTQRCLDADFAGTVYIRACQRGNPHQTWDISSDQVPLEYRKAQDGRSRFQIRNRATGQCLWIAAHANRENGGLLGTGDCWERPEAAFIDGAGDSFNSVHLRGWHGFTDWRPFCIGGNNDQAYAQRCNYGNDYQVWSRVAA